MLSAANVINPAASNPTLAPNNRRPRKKSSATDAASANAANARPAPAKSSNRT